MRGFITFLINLIDEKHYKKDDFIKNNIYKYVEFYLLNLMRFKSSRNSEWKWWNSKKNNGCSGYKN